MKLKHLVYFALALSLLLSTGAVQAVIPSATAASMLWQKNVIDDNEPGVRNLSTAFVGNNKVPMMIWGKTDQEIVHWAYRTLDGDGNCGPNDSWRCDPAAWAFNLVDGTLSNLATESFINTHVISWAFQSGSFIRFQTIEQHDDMSWVDAHIFDLVDLSKFGGILVGAPSLAIDRLRFRMAFTATESGGGDFPLHQVVYMYYTGIPNNSCKDDSPYQCDVIEISYDPAAIGTPSLQVALDGSVGIAYYKNGAIRYAYPWGGTSYLRPANCGGGTWRCINITDPSTGTVGYQVKLAYGSSNTAAGILYSFKPTDKDMLMRATYVGSGGDCGADGFTTGLEVIKRWDCNDVDAFIDDINATTYSIAIDPEDYPVVAWNNKFTGDTRQRLYLAYPAARSGTGGGWVKEIIDGNDWSTTGTQAALSISKDGLGFIGYMQPSYRACGEWYCLLDNSPNLKAAFQVFKTYLPRVQH